MKFRKDLANRSCFKGRTSPCACCGSRNIIVYDWTDCVEGFAHRYRCLACSAVWITNRVTQAKRVFHPANEGKP